ncbi:MAG TPA: LacI family transcriptional regulator, partial [Phycisphaerales bacterium]|nr:LacI family transcriptional regulator [Phycisphaerales bacterium]
DQMLRMGDNRPTAICCAADIYAITMCNVLRKKGLSVPKDLALVGFDNSQVSLLNDPPLTTMAMPYLEMGKAAGRLLIEMIGDPTMVSRTINLDCQLIERKTCSLIM